MYVLSIIGIIVFGLILNALAKNFKTKENKMQALKLVSYAATPWLVLGIASIYPPIAFISLLGGLYGLYILYLGIPILMETPKEQQMSYFIIGLIVYIVIMGIISWLVGWIWWHLALSASWGYYGYGYYHL
jgi:ABC-type Na+ efflux pump permease subunit